MDKNVYPSPVMLLACLKTENVVSESDCCTY